MAQAKAQTKRSGPQKSTGKRSNSRGTKSRAASAKRSAKPSNPRGAKSRAAAANHPTARRTRSSRASTPSVDGHGATESIKDTVSSGAESIKDTVSSGAETVAEAAQKAKVPLIAGGAVTIAGVAGAVALASRFSGGPKVLGVRVGRRNGFKMPGRRGGLKRDARKLASAITETSGRVDRLGRNVSKVASAIRQVSETADEAAKKV